MGWEVEGRGEGGEKKGEIKRERQREEEVKKPSGPAVDHKLRHSDSETNDKTTKTSTKLRVFSKCTYGQTRCISETH